MSSCKNKEPSETEVKAGSIAPETRKKIPFRAFRASVAKSSLSLFLFLPLSKKNPGEESPGFKV